MKNMIKSMKNRISGGGYPKYLKGKTSNKGISLIVLIITIIVIIILATAVIISITANNPIERSGEASFKSSLKSYESELALYIAEQLLEDNYYDSKTLNVSRSSGKHTKNGLAETLGGIQTVITSMKDEHAVILNIVEGKLTIDDRKATEYELNWADELGIAREEIYEPKVAKVNAPILGAGLTPIIFDASGNAQDTSASNSDWYAYIANQAAFETDDTNDINLRQSKWANARTNDGSQWVWIPRYAYKIKSQPTNPSTSGGEIDIIFLKGKTDKYEDDTGTLQDLPEDYIVHPAFTDESSTNYANGGWDDEITGIWVAKYEAGFAGVNGIPAHANPDTSLTYTATSTTSNIYYTTITAGTTPIKYPIFKPNAYTYNCINIGDSYALCRELSATGNPYGLTSDSYSHMMKNSEWGAVAYLTQSKYGRNGNEIRINNCSLDDAPATILTLTGIGASTHNASETNNSSSADNQYNGQYGFLASTTGNIYGIYDISGGARERMAGYIKDTTQANLRTYGRKMTDPGNTGTALTTSSKYISIYNRGNASNSEKNNYEQAGNASRKGEAIWETSTTYGGYNSWFGDYSNFPSTDFPFFDRGGTYAITSRSGVFHFFIGNGGSGNLPTFRPVLAFSEL